MKILSCILFLFLIVTPVLGAEEDNVIPLGDMTNHTGRRPMQRQPSVIGLNTLPQMSDDELQGLTLSLNNTKVTLRSFTTGKVLELEPAPKGKRRSRTSSTSSQTAGNSPVEGPKSSKSPS